MQQPIFILNGPNLNLVGEREPHIYGSTTLADIERFCREHAEKLGLAIDFRQSNHEGELVNWIQDARKRASGLILNAGAYSHTSIAILDALRALCVPAIEVHLSNPFARELFRQHSYVSLAVAGVICGLGVHGYLLGLDAIARKLNPHEAAGAGNKTRRKAKG